MQEGKTRRLARTLVEVAKDDPNLQQQQGSAGGLGAIVAAESVSPGQLDGVGGEGTGRRTFLLFCSTLSAISCNMSLILRPIGPGAGAGAVSSGGAGAESAGGDEGFSLTLTCFLRPMSKPVPPVCSRA